MVDNVASKKKNIYIGKFMTTKKKINLILLNNLKKKISKMEGKTERILKCSFIDA